MRRGPESLTRWSFFDERELRLIEAVLERPMNGKAGNLRTKAKLLAEVRQELGLIQEAKG